MAISNDVVTVTYVSEESRMQRGADGQLHMIPWSAVVVRWTESPDEAQQIVNAVDSKGTMSTREVVALIAEAQCYDWPV